MLLAARDGAKMLGTLLGSRERQKSPPNSLLGNEGSRAADAGFNITAEATE